jgi:hypothetical protein
VYANQLKTYPNLAKEQTGKVVIGANAKSVNLIDNGEDIIEKSTKSKQKIGRPMLIRKD